MLNKISEQLFPKKFLKKCGRGVKISLLTRITGLNNISIGNYVWIEHFGVINGTGGLKIGNNVIIAPNLLLLTTNHNYDSSEMVSIPYDTKSIHKPVVIEDNVWIGARVSICPGVRIGKNSVIGMGSVVTKDVEPYAVVGGNPAKIIKFRTNIEHYKNLEEKQSFYLKNKLGKL